MPKQNPLIALIHDNEQDRANADQWWKSASIESKLRVWDRIQAEYDDPAMEIMSRLAQLAFGEMAEKHGG